MRILFIDWISWQYTLNTPYSAPLSGSQSALCYLAEQLQQRGHEVWLFNNTPQIQSVRHVPHLPLSWLTLPFLEDWRPDVAIVLNTALKSDQLRSVLPPQTRFLLWTQHAADQVGVKPLITKETHGWYDQIVAVSQWQKQQYIHEFQLPAEKITVLQNAVAPCFENLFTPEESILKAKAHPLTLAYTSTPFRGLHLLLELMPSLEVTHPAVRLNVYSSMKVYQASNEEDWQQYGNLYQRCNELPNVNYIGSLPQPELAQVLRSTAIWAYTNTFAETSCISALEAMASGCYLITSEFGALPETTAGFADLIPFPADHYLEAYKQALEGAIQRFENPQEQAALDAHLRAQVDYINNYCTWSRRAYEWENYLEQLLREPAIVLSNWQRRLQHYFEHQQYKKVLSACENLINQFPDAYSCLAYQGAAYIALGLETEAQLLWSLYLSHFTEAEQDEITATWSPILLEIANISFNNQEIQFALAGYAYDFSPSLRGALKLLEISLQLNLGIDQIGHFLNQVISLISTSQEIENIETSYFIQLVQQLISYDPNTPHLTEFIEILSQSPSLRQHLSKIILERLKNDPKQFAPAFASVYLNIAEDEFGLYEFLARICCEGNLDELALYCVNKLFDFSLNPLGKDLGILSKLYVLQTFKYDLSYSVTVSKLYDEWIENAERCNSYLADNIGGSQQISFGAVFYSIAFYFCLTHQFDDPAKIKPIYNKRNNIFYRNAHYILPVINSNAPLKKAVDDSPTALSTEKIKVGFIGACFLIHPAAYQIRAFIRLYNRNEFEFYGYNPWFCSGKEDELSRWFQASFDHFYLFGSDALEIAQQIHDDQIDLLIDLDSCTSELTYRVLTLKAAPIQATWVGFDAAGLPTVDYFMVDPYVLPQGAQAWYTETLWRLPDCYLSLDGYEVAHKAGIREQLGLSADTVVFMCAQRTNKIQPEILKLQFAIVAAVPNAVLIIKYHRGSKVFEEWCRSLAEANQFDVSRLYFLTPNPADIHRATYYEVDVVLDTYPYAGGGMSLEALWMEVPIVTKVGQQFVARHTYTFLKNVGVEEGIAWTDEEYVNWGIRFGTEPELRQRVSWKLRQAKRHAPLWNPQRFSHEMEQALRAMVHRYRTGELVVPPRHRVGE